ncbi:CGNR zinc finger domain-containing protein [Propionibacteriaceae bacterium Y2011]|uniref:CGNR zinc finger domain-containing protein n=1 Tax=Microlunatus sp. Y2014 TaxID=3418488 RepID=UPI003B45A663
MAALVNTRVAGTLETVDDLDAFVREQEISGSRTHDENELKRVRAIRPELLRFFDVDEAGAVELVNRVLARERALPQLVRHDHWGWHLHAASSDSPLAVRLVVEAAMAMIDVVRAGDLSRLKHCAATDCDGVLVDLSRNRSKRYCDLGCGNRVAVAAYRARQREG